MSDNSVVIAPPPPLPYKDRSGWLLAFGIFEIMIGCVMLLMIAVTIFGMSQVGRVTPPPSVGPTPSPAMLITFAALFYGALAVLFVSVGIGSIQARNWARITMLIVSWCWLAQGVLGMGMIAVLLPTIMENARQQSRTPMPSSFDTIFRIAMFSIMGLFFVMLPLIIVLFYSGKNVKATCEARRAKLHQLPSATPDKPARPLKPAIIVTVIWFAFGTLTYTIMLFWVPVVPLFGFMLTGWGARAVIAVMAAVSGWLAWNLYRERLLAWRIAIGWLVLSWISALVTQWRIGFAEMYRAMGYGEAQMAQIMPFASFGMIFGLLFALAFFIFLIAIRKQFTDTGTLPA